MSRIVGRIAATAATVLLLVAGGPGWAQTAEGQPVKVIASLPTLTSAADYLMHARGFDKAHGLVVENTQAGGSSSLQIDAVLAGSAVFGAPGTATTLQAIREGANIKIIGAVAKNQIAAVIGNEALRKTGVAPDAPIGDRIKALRGLTIGTNPVGSTYTQMLRYYLQQNGLDPDRDVRLVGVADSTALIAGIEQGRFDAIVSASGVVEQALTLDAGQVWFSGARGDFQDAESPVVSLIVARSDTVENNPKLVDDFRAAMEDTLRSLNEDREENGRVLREQFFSQLDQKVWDTIWGNAVDAYPERFEFTRGSYEFWINVDPKGRESYAAVDYATITHPAARRD